MSQSWRHILVGVVALQALCLAPAVLAGGSLDSERLLPDIYPEAPDEPYHPFFDADWSIALRGSYTRTQDGDRFDTRLAPRISLDHAGARSSLNVHGDAELTRPNSDGQISVTGLRLGLQAGYDLDGDTRLTGAGNLSVTQALAGTPGVASDIAIPRRDISGGAELGITRRFGKFNVGVTGAINRNVYGPTTYYSGAIRDNSDQDYTAYTAGLRVGYQMTPIFEVFAQGDVGRDVFDRASFGGPRMDATDMNLRAGVTGRWNSVLEATVSTGWGLRRFDTARLGEVSGQLYDAQIRYTPDPTWRFGTGFTTRMVPTDSLDLGTTRTDYTATLSAERTVNSWLALRAMVDWNAARFSGSADTETGHGWGVGADYKLSAHTALTADYDYDYSDSTRNGTQTAHRVTMGVTLSR